MSKLQKTPSALGREHPALQNINFLHFLLFMWVIFALQDPNPCDQNQCWSGSATLINRPRGYGYCRIRTVPEQAETTTNICLHFSVAKAFKFDGNLCLTLNTKGIHILLAFSVGTMLRQRLTVHLPKHCFYFLVFRICKISKKDLNHPVQQVKKTQF